MNKKEKPAVASDFLLDISKYVLTAVIITSAFEELSDIGWMMYLAGIIGAALFLSVSVVMLIFLSTKKGQEWMRKFNQPLLLLA